jgi:5-methylcytosine-specific restriction endonuclease McrA
MKSKHAENELNRYYERRQLGIDKLGGMCVRCNSIDNLEFDHIDPRTKEFNLSANWSCLLSKWLTELDKCQLLCTDCHKIKTAESSTHNRWRYLRYKCRCLVCKEDYSIYRRIRYLSKGM